MKTTNILACVFLTIISVLLCSCASDRRGHARREPKQIEVRMNRNIELFGLLMQLDLAPDALNNNDVLELGGRMAKWRDWYSGAVRNYERFKGFENGSMMKLYRDSLGQGMFNDFFIGFLLQVTEVPNAKIKDTTDVNAFLGFSKTGDRAEATQKAGAFLEALNRFYGEINFDGYLKDNQKHYDRMRAEVRDNLPSTKFISAMESFYDQKFTAYCLVPSLNIPTGMGFGKTDQTSRTIYNTFGPFGFQTFDGANPNMGFNQPESIQVLSVHEFGHSFINPVIDSIPRDVIRQTEGLYAPLAEKMKSQGYISWTICLYEHFVRAGEVVIARKLGNATVAEHKLAEDKQKGFAYLPQIVRELEAFEKRSNKRESYQERVGQIVARLTSTAGL